MYHTIQETAVLLRTLFFSRNGNLFADDAIKLIAIKISCSLRSFVFYLVTVLYSLDWNVGALNDINAGQYSCNTIESVISTKHGLPC